MSFTPDEIQSLNEILDEKLTSQRRELERAFDQRLQALRRAMELRLSAAQQEIIASVTQKLDEQQKRMQAQLGQKLHSQQLDTNQALSQELQQRQKQLHPQLEALVDRALAAQLLAIEELLNQRIAPPLQNESGEGAQVGERPPQFEAIEVQTELPWEDLVNIFGRALDERFETLKRSTQESIRNWEQYLSLQLRILQSDMHDEIVHSRQPQAFNGSLTSMQEVFQSIEQLERMIESLQVAMTSNHALLSNRLYRHQQLPLERAHGAGLPQSQPPSTPPPHSTFTSAHDTDAAGPRKESNVS